MRTRTPPQFASEAARAAGAEREPRGADPRRVGAGVLDLGLDAVRVPG